MIAMTDPIQSTSRHSTWSRLSGLALGGVVGFGAGGCSLPSSTLGLACEMDSHCDAGQSCQDGLCVAGGAETSESGGQTDDGSSGHDSSASAETSESGSASESADSSSSESTGGPDCACQKLDILFVLDNSVSFSAHAMSLALGVFQATPEINDFVDTICDFHAGVTTSLPKTNNPAECQMLGALGTTDADGDSCGYADQGRSYITKQDDFQNDIVCALNAGITLPDGGESPMGAMFAALGDPLNQPGACNEGFLRDDAPLLLIVISDVDEHTHPGTAAQWYDALVAIKGGDENVSLVEVIDFQGPPNGCTIEEASTLEDLRSEFLPTHATAADICDGGLGAFFSDAISGQGNAACNDFEP
jgi:hypothetical protein